MDYGIAMEELGCWWWIWLSLYVGTCLGVSKTGESSSRALLRFAFQSGPGFRKVGYCSV